MGGGREEPAPAPERRAAPAVAAPSPAVLAAAGSRRALIDREGRLAGFEFRIAGPLELRLRRSSDAVARAAHSTAVLGSMQSALAAGRAALFTMPLGIAARPSVLASVPTGAMIALTDGPWATEDPAGVIARLRETGAHLGGLGKLLPGGEFILLEGQPNAPGVLALAAEDARRTDPRVQVVATGLSSIDELEAALRQGVDLAAGAVDQGGAPQEVRNLSASLLHVCQLLNRLVQDDELKPLSDDLRKDMDLSYRLLRYASSPLLGLTRAAESVEEAVMLIGRDGLYRWLTVLLLANAEQRPTSRALQEVALARARLLELLAPRLGAPPAAMFTTGLLSLLEVALRMPLAEALRPLQLPAPARQALLENAGPWARALDLARALERDEGRAVEALAPEFGGYEAVYESANSAWSWAADAAGHARGP